MSSFKTAVVAVVLVLSIPQPADAATAWFSPPTDAPVLDPFRLPEGPYGPGNRGIEYATGDGDLVRAAADGVVGFSGAVAGNLFVSIDHPGGLRSTYGFVARTLVRAGTEVRRGDIVAITAGPFHFTVRLHGTYVDPASLFGAMRTVVRLVPHRPGPGRADSNPSGTLLDGPYGPRTSPRRDRRNHWVRATPGRLGVPHGHATGKEENHGSHLHEAAAGGRRPLRPPDPPLEPEDEAVHPR